MLSSGALHFCGVWGMLWPILRQDWELQGLKKNTFLVCKCTITADRIQDRWIMKCAGAKAVFSDYPYSLVRADNTLNVPLIGDWLVEYRGAHLLAYDLGSLPATLQQTLGTDSSPVAGNGESCQLHPQELDSLGVTSELGLNDGGYRTEWQRTDHLSLVGQSESNGNDNPLFYIGMQYIRE